MKPKERPILFNGEMVRAVLDGRKTQTRRVVMPRPPAWTWNSSKWDDDCINVSLNDGRDYWVKCPYGQPGDLLWVRETWRADIMLNHLSPSEIAAQSWEAGYGASIKHPACALWYEADDTYRKWGSNPEHPGRLRPSIHMPRWASRITLRVTDVRVERVQDISPIDALNEGYPMLGPVDPDTYEPDEAIEWFADLWSSINAARGYGWDANPWAWVVEFEKVNG